MTDVPQQKPRGRPFQKGESANPTGRPKGARDRATTLAENLMRSDLPSVVRTVIDAAIGGDTTAARLILERLVPTRRGRAIEIDLPTISSAPDLIAVASRITHAAATGQVTCEEAASLIVVVDFARRAIETTDFEMRLAALEEKT